MYDSGKMPVMTGKGTTRRSVRIPDEVWEPALAKAEAEGKNLSEILREVLVKYVDEAKD